MQNTPCRRDHLLRPGNVEVRHAVTVDQSEGGGKTARRPIKRELRDAHCERLSIRATTTVTKDCVVHTLQRYMRRARRSLRVGLGGDETPIGRVRSDSYIFRSIWKVTAFTLSIDMLLHHQYHRMKRLKSLW